MINWDADVLGPCEGVFGEDLTPTYTPPGVGGVPFALPGIFDDAHTGLQMGDAGEPEVSTLHAVFGFRYSQCVVAPVQGGKLLVPRIGKAFKVVDVQPDGHGAGKLILSETP